MFAASRTAPTWAPMTPPTVRTTVFMPVAMPVSVGLTASTISFGMTANDAPTPRPQRMNHTAGCHGSAWKVAMPADPIATSTIPATSGPRGSWRRP